VLLRELFADDGAQAIAEYALVAAVFAVIMIAALVAIETAAGGTLSKTQNNLGQVYENP
jgi:Flp pilus assembly pilin Flp